MIYKCVIWILVAALAMATPAAHAAGFDIAAGPSVTSSGHVAPAVFASVYGRDAANPRWRFEPIGTLGWIGTRDSDGAGLDHAVLVVAGGVRILAPGHHWFASEQLAADNRTTDALSSRLEFMTSIGWQHGNFVLIVRHVSNGHVLGSGKNLGETMLLAGLRW